MVIKIRKRNKKGEQVEYKSNKKILTPQDIKEADKFDLFLNKEIKEIEKVLLKEKVISEKGVKKDPLKVWYIIGKHINEFLESKHVVREDEHLFWDYLYGRSSLINKTLPLTVISKTRNDFKIASLLAKYPLKLIRSVGSWALWREILGYNIFLNDKRVLNFVINELIKFPRTRDKARPFLKSICNRFKKIDSSVLNDKELSRILKKIRE